MLSLRVSCPASLCAPVEALLRAEPTMSSLTVHRRASLTPPGDVFLADLPRETAGTLVDSLMDIGVQQEGAVTLTPVGAWISRSGLVAERRAPGRSPDSVVWAEVTERAYSETELTWTYVSFMILATLLAAIAIVTDSVILVIGAMVLGPEFVPIAALGLGMVRRRPGLVHQALRTLLIGFAVSISVVAVVALLARVTGFIDVSQIESARPGTAFIYPPTGGRSPFQSSRALRESYRSPRPWATGSSACSSLSRRFRHRATWPSHSYSEFGVRSSAVPRNWPSTSSAWR